MALAGSSIQKILEGIEKEAEQDFSLLISTGPSFFATSQLLELRGRIRERESIYAKLSRLILLVGAISPSFLVLGLIFATMGWLTVAAITVVLFPLFSLIALGGLFLLRTWLGSKGDLEYLHRLVEEELQCRKLEADNQRRRR